MAARVLIADDEVLLALSIADILEAAGHAVEVAFDGTSALAKARDLGDALQVLVTDLNMPGLTGAELMQALRVAHPSLPVVVVTGSAPPGGAAALRRQAGGDGTVVLLHKPFDYEELALAVCLAAAGRGGQRAVID